MHTTSPSTILWKPFGTPANPSEPEK